jgi:hypothetical protein
LKTPLAICAVLVATISGCGRENLEQQFALEHETAGVIQQLLALHEATSPQVAVTNLAQTFASIDLTRLHRKHPYFYQSEFQKFGKHAGFKDSFYEKFILFSPGISISNPPISGVLVVLSAETFLDMEEKPVRMLTWRAGSQDYRSISLAEDRVQRIFKELGLSIPKPLPSPPAAPPTDVMHVTWTDKLEGQFDVLAFLMGLPGRGRLVRNATLGVVVVLLTGLVFWLWRRTRH